MYLILLFVLIFAVFVKFRHTKIKFKTFFKKGFAPQRGRFGVYCYCGKQGSGKTYSAVEFLLSNKDMKIYSNVRSLKGVKYTPIGGFDDLLKLRSETNCIIFFDEIFTALSKKSSSRLTRQQSNEVLDFLSQMRKRKIIFITTAQEWLEMDMTLRRYCRFQIECNMINFLGFGLLIKSCYNAEQMRWSANDNEYIAPLVETTISKCNKKVADSYDTFEQIKT